MNHAAFIRERRKLPVVKTIAIVGAVALLLIPTWLLIHQDLAFQRRLNSPIAMVDVMQCGDHETAIIMGSGNVQFLQGMSDHDISTLAKVVGKGNAGGVEIPCDVAPTQQAYLQ